MKKIYARKGEKVTCENGHEICNFSRTIKTGEYHKRGDLINWKQKEPVMGGKIPVCAICGSDFYKNDSFAGIRLHFQDGWR